MSRFKTFFNPLLMAIINGPQKGGYNDLSGRAWDIVTALRGPDAPNYLADDFKMEFVAPIRWWACGERAAIYGFAFAAPGSEAGGNETVAQSFERLKAKLHRSTHLLSYIPTHTIDHVLSAMAAIIYLENNREAVLKVLEG